MRPTAVEITDNYITNISYDASQNPQYVGKALPGTADNATGWAIKKITWDVNNNPTAVEWAGGTDAFDKIWDSRASYSYS